jgi:hypothetical protein
MYTLQIDVLSDTPLDGTTPLNIDQPGVTVDRETNRTLIVTLDAVTVPLFGRIDPGQVIESQLPRLAGKPLLLIGFSATAAGQPFPLGPESDVLQRVTPIQGVQEGIQTIADLGEVAVQGMVFGDPQIFPLAHIIAITTTVAGPTRLIFVLKELTDEDVVKLGCCDGGGSPLTTEDEGALVDADTTLYNFIGAGVTAAAAGPPGEVDVTIPGAAAGAPNLDYMVEPFAVPAPPLLFLDMPPYILSRDAVLPTITSGLLYPNRLWLGGMDIQLDLTPGSYDLTNTDVRGGDPDFLVTEPFVPDLGQTGIRSGFSGLVTFDNPKRVADLEINVGDDGGPDGGPFFFGVAGAGTGFVFIENVLTFVEVNGALGDSAFIFSDNYRATVDRCIFLVGGFQIGAVDTLRIDIEDDNIFGPSSIQGGGAAALSVRGTGNHIDPLAADVGLLDVDIGHNFGSEQRSGQETHLFGAGNGALAVPGPGDTVFLYPGGGNIGDAAVVPSPGPIIPAMASEKGCCARGIFIQTEALIGATTITVDLIQGGLVVYSETLPIPGAAGTFISTTFGLLPGSGAFSLRVVNTGAAPVSWDAINVSVLVK